MRRETIRDQLEKIRRLAGNVDLRTGMLRLPGKRAGKYSKVTLFALFVSDENSWLVRPHIFETSEGARTPEQWHAWFADHYTTTRQENGHPGILQNILDHISLRTGGKHWRIYRVIGWAANDRSEIINPKAATKRNKTKPKRRARGHVHTRR